MKTTFNTPRKDSIGSAALLAASFVAIVGGMVSSSVGAATAAPSTPILRMEAIVVTAPRLQTVVVLDAIVVTATRDVSTQLAAKNGRQVAQKKVRA